MEHRSLGATGIQVSEIGFGAWAIGGDAWGAVEDAESLAALRQALDSGITFLDTADVYGAGRSEELVGRAIEGRRGDIVLSTKGGLWGHHRDPEREPVYDRPEKVTAALEASLRRLGTDYVDVYFCHIWWDDDRETEAFLAGFEQMKRDGKARAVGVSTDKLDHLRHYAEGRGIDAVQLDYSILNRAPEDGILPYAEEKGLGVVVRGPLHKGLLTGKFGLESRWPEGDIRHSWPQEAWYGDRIGVVERLRSLERPGQTLGQAALRFVLSHPAVSVAIPGAKTPQQVQENAAASDRPLLSPEDRRMIEEATGALVEAG